jgi:hypothetical protein
MVKKARFHDLIFLAATATMHNMLLLRGEAFFAYMFLSSCNLPSGGYRQFTELLFLLHHSDLSLETDLCTLL